MEEEDNIIVKWAQEDVETSYNLINNNNNINLAMWQHVIERQVCCVQFNPLAPELFFF